MATSPPVPRAWLPFSCDVEPHRETVTVVVRGELDLATAPELAVRVRELVEVGFESIEVDLSAVGFIDLAGARVIVRTEQEAVAAGCTLTVLPGPPEVRRVLAMPGLVGPVPSAG